MKFRNVALSAALLAAFSAGGCASASDACESRAAALKQLLNDANEFSPEAQSDEIPSLEDMESASRMLADFQSQLSEFVVDCSDRTDLMNEINAP